MLNISTANMYRTRTGIMSANVRRAFIWNLKRTTKNAARKSRSAGPM
jgi:hypothetical protein